MRKGKPPEAVKAPSPCPYCLKAYTFYEVLGNPGYCAKPKCLIAAMRDGI